MPLLVDERHRRAAAPAGAGGSSPARRGAKTCARSGARHGRLEISRDSPSIFSCERQPREINTMVRGRLGTAKAVFLRCSSWRLPANVPRRRRYRRPSPVWSIVSPSAQWLRLQKSCGVCWPKGYRCGLQLWYFHGIKVGIEFASPAPHQSWFDSEWCGAAALTRPPRSCAHTSDVVVASRRQMIASREPRDSGREVFLMVPW